MPQSSLTPEIVIQIVANVIALVAAVAAWRAARASFLSAAETRRGSQAQLVSSLLDSYASAETLASMICLRKWFSQHGRRAADEFRRLRQDDYAAIAEVDHARRRVSHFFQKLYVLHNSGYLDERAVRTIATKDTVAFFRGLIEPLEAAIGVDYDRSSFNFLGALYNIPPTLPSDANP